MHKAVSANPVVATLATSAVRPGVGLPSVRTRSSTKPEWVSACSQKKRKQRRERSSRKASSELDSAYAGRASAGRAAGSVRKLLRDQRSIALRYRTIQAARV